MIDVSGVNIGLGIPRRVCHFLVPETRGFRGGKPIPGKLFT